MKSAGMKELRNSDLLMMVSARFSPVTRLLCLCLQ